MCANPVSCQFRSVGHDEQHFQNIQVIFKLNKSFVWPNLVEIFCAQVTEIWMRVTAELQLPDQSGGKTAEGGSKKPGKRKKFFLFWQLQSRGTGPLQFCALEDCLLSLLAKIMCSQENWSSETGGRAPGCLLLLVRYVLLQQQQTWCFVKYFTADGDNWSFLLLVLWLSKGKIKSMLLRPRLGRFWREWLLASFPVIGPPSVCVKFLSQPKNGREALGNFYRYWNVPILSEKAILWKS